MGAAVAFAAQRLHTHATIFVPSVASPAKVDRIRSYGADLVIAGERYADALAASEVWTAQSGALPVHAYNDVETLLGQGTIALELEQQASKLDTLLVAVGGGGLGSYRTRRLVPRWGSDRRSYNSNAAPTLTAALAAGFPVDAPTGGIAADSLAAKRVGDLMFPLAQDFVDSVVLVSDEDIQRAQELLWDLLRIAAEPGGAAALAALVSKRGRGSRSNERVGVLICGGNTNAVAFRTTATSLALGSVAS